MMGRAAPPPLGARVVIRDAEWVIRRIDHTSDGGDQLTCDGISELVRGREAVFLTTLEPEIEVLDPATTRLVPDESPAFTDSLLYMESKLRQAVPNDGHIRVARGAAMDIVPYQFDPARQALGQPRQRILIADAVGLGKTMEAGILVSELIARGRGKRILVLAVKSMLTQFQKEFWTRFTIPLTRLDSVGIQRLRRYIPANHNPFHYHDKSIISIDTLKQSDRYRTYLEQAYWDIIVIDEAHNVAERGTQSTRSLRSRLARLLARRSDTLIMLSATPHDGKARSFASLINMLDPTAITNPEQFSKEDFRNKGLVVRRFKKDVRGQVQKTFRDREVFPVRFPVTALEEAAHETLLAVSVAGTRGKTLRRDLFTVTLEKALFSSPAACISTIDKRIRRRNRELDKTPNSAVEVEVASLRCLRDALLPIGHMEYSKYRALLRAIRGGTPFKWRKSHPKDRLVIFTERRETLDWLHDRLIADLELKSAQVEKLHGGMSDTDQQRVVEDFGNEKKPVRLLVASDVASEGINLHYQCHRLIHFDIPWSLMVFSQRNGRVDRYGQERTPKIVYLVAKSANETIGGDLRVLEILVEKDDQAYQNIGDPSIFMNQHDIELEKKVTANAIAAGESAARFDERLTERASEGEELLNLFLGLPGSGVPAGAKTPPRVFEAAPGGSPSLVSLFANDLAYCEAALQRLKTKNPGLRFEADHASKTLTVDAPRDLQDRFDQAPREIRPEHWRFVLTTDQQRMNEEIAKSRRDEKAWPQVQYLWRLNPVAAWLSDRTLAAFGRHEAPVIVGVPGLATNETIFVLSGLLTNRKSHPLVREWLGVTFAGDELKDVVPLDDVLERTGIGTRSIANRPGEVDTGRLARLLPDAVEWARDWVDDERRAFNKIMNAKLNEEMKALDDFKARREDEIKRKLDKSSQAELFSPEPGKRAKRELDELKRVSKEHNDWVRDTMTTEDEPHIEVVCALTGRE